MPFFRVLEASLNSLTPESSSPEPFTSFSDALERVVRESFSSSIESALSRPNSERVSADATVAVTVIWKSFTSAVNSKESGILNFWPMALSFSFRLSDSPGKATPMRMCLLPSEISLAFSIFTFEKCSVGSTTAVIMVNGV